jgi:DNA-directed RNA polymerase specialized sigma24 family protein
VHLALPDLSADREQGQPSRITGLLAHLDVVYGFAFTLVGDRDSAAELTERVFGRARDGLWSTLGGHSVRDRLLARCVSTFAETLSVLGEDTAVRRATGPRPAAGLAASLRELPWKERAAVALVDQCNLSYPAGAAVLGIDIAEFRKLLRHGRSVLFAAYCIGAR